ncbi:TM243-like protein [Mya arenaria]|uniref:TM243-like protein n=1 Tax=Mya arenaria TaxID=6604 RepID=A0ABY7FYH9_MYAAR|nr:TM243-like protein [Mya arenaria]
MVYTSSVIDCWFTNLIRIVHQSDLFDLMVYPSSPFKDRICNLVLASFTGILVAVTLIYWYRQGDLEPKFLRLIFYNAFTMILLCICGNLYIHNIGYEKK